MKEHSKTSSNSLFQCIITRYIRWTSYEQALGTLEKLISTLYSNS